MFAEVLVIGIKCKEKCSKKNSELNSCLECSKFENSQVEIMEVLEDNRDLKLEKDKKGS